MLKNIELKPIFIQFKKSFEGSIKDAKIDISV